VLVFYNSGESLANSNGYRTYPKTKMLSHREYPKARRWIRAFPGLHSEIIQRASDGNDIV